MMMLDAFTVNVLVAVVVLVSGTVYILDTLLRLEVGAGRVWAVSFLCGMLTVVCYLMWRAVPDPWLAIAAGEGWGGRYPCATDNADNMGIPIYNNGKRAVALIIKINGITITNPAL